MLTESVSAKLEFQMIRNIKSLQSRGDEVKWGTSGPGPASFLHF